MKLPDAGSANSDELIVHSQILFEYALDEPLPHALARGTVTTGGWAVSQPDGIKQVEVWLDRTRLGEAKYGFPRPDVTQNFKGQIPRNCGYRSTFDFNPQLIGAGEKQLRVILTSLAGQQRELAVPVQVQVPESDLSTEAYRKWREQQPLDSTTLESQQIAFAQLNNPVCFRIELVSLPDTQLSQLQATLDSLQAQTYSAWELYFNPPGQEQWAAFAGQDNRTRLSNNRDETLERAKWLVILEPGDRLLPQALFCFYQWWEQHPETVAIYADEDWLDEANELGQPFFKPDWSPEYLRQTNYIGSLLAVRPAALIEAGLWPPEAEAETELVLALGLRLAEQPDLQVGHIAEVLCHRSFPPAPHRLEQQVALVTSHLNRTNRAAVATLHSDRRGWQITALPRRYYPSISLLLRPGQLEPEQLEKYLDKFFQIVQYPNLELLILAESAKASLSKLPVPAYYLQSGEKTGLATRFNQAVTRAEGTYLLFLDQASAVLSLNWPECLLDYAEQPEVGAVGGLILTKHNTVAEAGLRLHPNEGILPLLRGYPAGTNGYGKGLVAAREVSALNLQGLLVRKNLFEQFGGFNPLFESRYAGIDFCLRLRQRGFRLVFSPDAVLKETGPSWLDDSELTLEKMLLLDIWQDYLEKSDPYYNPNFNQNYSDYRL